MVKREMSNVRYSSSLTFHVSPMRQFKVDLTVVSSFAFAKVFIQQRLDDYGVAVEGSDTTITL